MALLKYLERKRSALPDERACSSTSLTGKDLKLANQAVEQCLRKDSATLVTPKETWMKYNDYTPEQQAEIGRYAAENGPTRAATHFSRVLNTTFLVTHADIDVISIYLWCGGWEGCLHLSGTLSFGLVMIVANHNFV